MIFRKQNYSGLRCNLVDGFYNKNASKVGVCSYFLVFVFFVLSPVKSSADVYILAMSKDSKVCQHTLSLFNSDLREKGGLAIDDHAEFNEVKWNEGITTHSRGRVVEQKYKPTKLGVFDINNDGGDEVVLSYKYYLSGSLRDKVDVLPGDFSEKNEIYDWSEIIKSRVATVPEKIVYYLKDFPPQKKKEFHGELREYFINIGGFLDIRPMRYEDSFYVVLFGTYGQSGSYVKFEDRNVVVVGRFDRENRLHDMCYLIRVYSL